MHLDLRQPLNYINIEVLPSSIAENDEFILCYQLNPAQNSSIEPDREQFLGNLVFIGQKTSCITDVNMPAGQYLFVQYRNKQHLSQNQWLDAAIEQQKDGLWERNKLENLLYVRFLYEDGKNVTQIFRTIG